MLMRPTTTTYQSQHEVSAFRCQDKNFLNEKGRNGEKVKKQDGMSTIIVNYSDKIIRK